jgi:uracil-DNA glycosylase family 4
LSKPEDIYDKQLTRAISEINELCRELTHCEKCAHGMVVPVIGSGHPLADIFLVKYRAHPSEASEGVAFYGRAGEAIQRGCQKLHIDSLLLYGTNVLKCANAEPGETRQNCPQFLMREIMIVQPKLIVVMGEETMDAVNELEFPLAQKLEFRPGEIQPFTPTCEALVTPDVDDSLDDQRQKTLFWKAFKILGDWYESLPPY